MKTLTLVLWLVVALAVIADRVSAMRRREDVETLLMLRHPLCLFGHDPATFQHPNFNAGIMYTDCTRCRYIRFRMWLRSRKIETARPLQPCASHEFYDSQCAECAMVNNQRSA